jgi:endonuclease-3
MNAEKRLAIFERLSHAIPNPTTELQYNSTFELLIAVILSAQATDKGVNLATNRLFAVANTPEAIFALGIDGLMPYIQTIGLYQSKAKNVIATCQQLIVQHKSLVPNDREALEALPGVGRKTANVILNTAFGKPTIAVDTHLYRLGNRIKLATGKTVLAVEHKYLKTIPKAYLKDAHHLLILHGRYTCIARKPKCAFCCIEDLCEFNQKSYDTDPPHPRLAL